MNTPLLSRNNNSRQIHKAGGQEGKKFGLRLFVAFFAKYYWWVIASIGIILFAIQTIEHFTTTEKYSDFHFYYYGEIMLVVLLLGITGFMIRMFLLSLAEKTRANNILHLKHEVRASLSADPDIAEVSRRLIQLVASIIPSEEIRLYFYDSDKNWSVQAAFFDVNEPRHATEALPQGVDPYPCRHCLTQSETSLHSLKDCRQDEDCALHERNDGFCLPLVDGIKPVGMLHLYNPCQPVPEKIELIENAAVDIAHVIGTAVEEKAREEQRLADKIHAVQMDIARDLHDTAGQNVSYLRMKLDHLSEVSLTTPNDMQMEIRNMSRVANELYDYVRGTLAVLQSDGAGNLFQLLTGYAQQVEKRSTFKLDFNSRGKPKSFPADRMRQLFYIFREALSNIEKHAHASRVSIEMSRGEDDLTLAIADDGCGFDTTRVISNDHYGLKFMQDRTEMLNGSISIHSEVGVGTNILIRVPYV